MGTEPVRLPDEAIESIRAEVQRTMDRQGVPAMSIAVGAEGKLAFTEGFGQSDVENGVPASAETKFRTASIAKSLTAVAVMQLAAEGKLDLDKPVDQYISFPNKKWSFTPRQLLGHLAGVRHYQGGGESTSTRYYRSVESGLSTFAHDPLLHEPGTKFLYSTFGYNLLGALVEEVSGKSFAEYIDEHICQPSGMTCTVVDHHFHVIPHRARGYIRVRPGGRREIPRGLRGVLEQGELYNAPMHDTSYKIPGGGLLSTSSDLVRFAMALNEGKLVPADLLEEMWAEQKTTSGESTGYGLGFRLYSLDGTKVVGHSGGQAGVSTLYMLSPSSNTTVAVMCNLQHAELQQVCQHALRAASTVAVTATVAAEPQATDYSQVTARLGEFIERERKQKDLPAVSITLVDGDQVVWGAGFGPQGADGNEQATAESVYRVGSVSKLFTDMALMKLVAEGKVDLDADVQDYLPDFQPKNDSGKPVTLRQLTSHRAGIVREPPVGHYFDPTEPTIAETVASLNKTNLVYPPGTQTKYSNAAIAVVGHVVERVSGQEFERYVQDNFLKPMAMKSSSFYLLPELKGKLAQGWMWSHHAPRFEPPLWDLGTLPAGNLYASTNDLGNFLITVLNEGRFQKQEVLSSGEMRAMLEPAVDEQGRPTQYGVGFRLGELDGHRTFGHGGAVYGYATQVTGMPDEKIGVAAVASLDVANGFTRRLTDYALRLMLAAKSGKPLPEIESSEPLPKGRAEQMEGTYEGDGKSIEIYEFNDRLFALDNYTVRELRKSGDKLVVDDVHGYGPTWEVGSDNSSLIVGGKTLTRAPDTLPAACPDRWKGLIGEYGWDHNVLYIYESGGQLRALIEWFYDYPLTEVGENEFAFPKSEGLYFGEKLFFKRDSEGIATEVEAAEVVFQRRPVGLYEGKVFQIQPTRPVEELRRDALAARPPVEPRDLRPSELVELKSLEPSILYDIRYAGDRNFMGTPFYTSSHAYLQRPAAEAVVRAHRKLADKGYGLLIHDAYRPWFVTKMFWDGTPENLHDFVADPEKGSRHNRGCAVDLTLYDLKTQQPVETVAGYDEFSPRSYPLYPGGTSQQRWFRRLLRNAMEEEGFTIYEFEWWHFDYKDWQQYPIGNTQFEQLSE